MAIANALNTLPNAVYWAVVIDTSPRSRTGTNSGIMHLFAASASIIAPTLTGYLVSAYGYNSMFVAAGVVMAIGMLSMLMVRPGKSNSSSRASVARRQPTPRQGRLQPPRGSNGSSGQTLLRLCRRPTHHPTRR